MAGNVALVTQADFDSVVLASDVPVLVDFWAVWCGPCKAITPLVEAVAEAAGSTLKVCKVDVDTSPQVAMRYGIRSIPTLLLFKGGKVVGQRSGGISREKIEAFVRDGK
jgi:thioredoxin 1